MTRRGGVFALTCVLHLGVMTKRIARRNRRSTSLHPVAKEALVKISTRSARVLSTCLLLGWSASALGAVGDDAMVSKTVKFRDLDISKAEGAQALYGRISAAARQVCLAQQYNFIRSCRARAVDDAVV